MTDHLVACTAPRPRPVLARPAAAILWLALLALAASLCNADALAQSAGSRQWRTATWPTGKNVTLFDLIEQGYEVKTFQLGLETTWLYVQKGRKVFRCNNPDIESQPLICEELVRPY